jgi:hypothetical protein
MIDSAHTRTTAARAFVRSLNILLKFARMYDFGHPRTAKQYDTAWTELRTALGSDDEAGLLLAVSGDQLLLDGTPLESAASEKSFAQMLSTAGIASIHFSPKVNQASLARFVRGFPTGSGSKPTQLAEQMKAALQGDPYIHVNEVCFVPADSAVAKTTVAAQLAARTLGMNSQQTDELLNDPEKLLQLIVAAEGTKGREGAGEGSGPGPGGGGYGSGGPGGSGEGNGEHSSGATGGSYGGGSLLNAFGNPELANPGTTLEGAVSAVHGSGGWNIVNSGGSGVAVEPSAGGFWLKKDFSAEQSKGGNAGTASLAEGAWTAGSSGPNSGAGIGSSAPGAGGSGGQEPRGNWARGSDGATGPLSGPAGAGRAGDVFHAPRSRWVHASSAIRVSRPTRSARAGSMSVETGLMTLHEDELQGILQVLAQIARTSDAPEQKLDPASFQSRLSVLPRRARFTVSQALSALAAQAPSEDSDRPTLLKLAEHIAVRFALESFERGDVKVNAVRQVLDEMSVELDGLRKILGVYEEKMMRAGIPVHSHADMLAREFWSHVPDEKRNAVLTSGDAWCVPPIKAREYIEKLIKDGKTEEAESILRNYAQCLKNKSAEARRQTALGLAELAPLYAERDEKLLTDSIREVGVQLAEERDSELQSLLGAAFVRLSQEATKNRTYVAIQRSVEMIDYVDGERPGAAKSLRPRIAIEDKLPDFIEESLRKGEIPNGLKDLLRRMPKPSAEHVAGRFSRVGFRQDCELLVSMMELLGPEGLEHLRARLREGNVNEAVDTIGILVRMDLEQLERLLPERMRDWKRSAHDRVVRQIAMSGSTERGRLLLELFDSLETLIRPLAIDEIGMAGEKLAEMRLLRIAEGDVPKGSTEYLRLKAIEALGRLRTSGSETVLRRLAETRKAWRWAHPSELRVVAAQALEKIDPDWVRDFLPRSGLNVAELSLDSLDSDPESSAIRQRRYPRLRMEKPVAAVTTNLKDNCQLEIPELALGGGVAVCQQHLHPGSVVELRMNGAINAVKAQSIVRDANTQARAFELVEMDLDERAKLRKLLVQLGSLQKQSRPEERSRRGTRTFITG